MASLSSGDIFAEVLPPRPKEVKESLLSFQLLVSEIFTIAVPSTSLISRTEKEKSKKREFLNKKIPWMRLKERLRLKEVSFPVGGDEGGGGGN